MFSRHIKLWLTVAAVALAFAMSAAPAGANHSWGGYHWARQSNPFTVTLGDNMSSAWDSYLVAASNDWSLNGSGTTPNPLNTSISAGLTTGRKCRAQSGRVEACNANYGYNGWLGLASIWISGSHITQGTVKLNDSYFNTSTYNTPAWRRSVTCQEVGHTFGLDHQSEDRNVDRDTCMDYYRVPNPSPNQHDYDQLALIYSHLDSSTTLRASATKGRGLKKVKDSLYVEDLGNGKRRYVWVFWTNRRIPHGPPNEG
jgi:hypothetical protein